jgi:hypothetical protein
VRNRPEARGTEEDQEEEEGEWVGKPWTWQDRRRKVVKDIIEKGTKQWRASDVISEMKGDTLRRTTTAERSVRGQRLLTDIGWTCFRETTWLSDQAIKHVLIRIAINNGYGLEDFHVPTGLNQRWLLDPLSYKQIRQGELLLRIPVTACERIAGIVQVGQNHWITAVVECAAREVHIIDPLGAGHAHREVGMSFITWLQKRGLKGSWMIVDTYSRRQYNGSDCGVFALCDILSRMEGHTEMMQRGA